MKIHPRRSRATLAGILVLALLLSAAPLAVAAPGDLDPSFDGDGMVTTSFGGPAYGGSCAVDNLGRIVLVGRGCGDRYCEDEGFLLARYLSDGSVDTSFGINGKVVTDFEVPGFFAMGYDVKIDTSGRIVVVGDNYNNNTDARDLALARYLSDGSLDPTFGNNGKVITDLGDNESAGGIALDSVGRIIVVGSTGSYPNEDFLLVRYLGDGSLDSSFGAGGKIVTDFGGWDRAGDVALDGFDRIIVSGRGGAVGATSFALARYLTDGGLDTAFDGDGRVVTSFGARASGGSVQRDASGRIVVAGYVVTGGAAGLDIAIARYLADGSLDTSFGTGGKVVSDFGGIDEGAADLAIGAADEIVIAGSYETVDTSDFAVERYLVDGSLDTSFGIAGRTTTDFVTYDYASAVALDSSGRILVVGSAEEVTDSDFAVARYLGDGVTPPTDTPTPTATATATATATLTATPTATATATATAPVPQRHVWLPVIVR